MVGSHANTTQDKLNVGKLVESYKDASPEVEIHMY